MKTVPTTSQNRNFYSFKLSNFWIQLLLVILLSLSLLSLGSCQAQNSSTDDKVVHLTLWHGVNPPPNRDVFQKLVDRFNQTHSDIQVQSIYAGQLEQQMPKVLTAVVGNAAPDILAFNPQITGQLVQLGAIQPLEDWLQQSPLNSEILPSLLEEMKLDGHIWSTPLFVGDIGVFYRRDLFKAAGITELPRTWEQLRQVAKKLTIDRDGDRYPDQYGLLMPLGKGEWTVLTWFPFMLSAGGTVLENNQPSLVNSGAIAALQFWQNLVQDGSTKFSAPERGFEEDDFIAGRVAMQFTGPWTLIMKSKVDFDVLPIPVNLKQATVLSSCNLFIMKTTPLREQAAWKFLEYVGSEEFQTEWAIGSGFLPVNLKSTQSSAYQEFVKQKPGLNVFLEQMKGTGTRPIIPGYNRLSESLGRAIEASMLGASPEKALQKAQKHLDLIWE